MAVCPPSEWGSEDIKLYIPVVIFQNRAEDLVYDPNTEKPRVVYRKTETPVALVKANASLLYSTKRFDFRDGPYRFQIIDEAEYETHIAFGSIPEKSYKEFWVE